MAMRSAADFTKVVMNNKKKLTPDLRDYFSLVQGAIQVNPFDSGRMDFDL